MHTHPNTPSTATPLNVLNLRIQDGRLSLQQSEKSAPGSAKQTVSNSPSVTGTANAGSALSTASSSLDKASANAASSSDCTPYDKKMTDALTALLYPNLKQIVFSNRSQQAGSSAGYFALAVTHKSLNLLVRKSIQVLKYQYVFSQHVLRLNGEVKDASFKQDFFGRVRQIIPLVREGRLSITTHQDV